MRVHVLSTRLAVTEPVIRSACEALGIKALSSMHLLTSEQVLDVVDWVQSGRFDAVRRAALRALEIETEPDTALGSQPVDDAVGTDEESTE